MLGSKRGRARGLGLGFGAAICFTCAAAPAQEPSPQTTNAVRGLVAQGEALVQAGDCVQALDRFRRAYALLPAPTVALREARCLVKLGRLIEGSEKYESVRRFEESGSTPPAFKRAAEEATEAIAELRERIPKLKLTIVGPGADSPDLVVHIDGNVVPSALLGVEQPIDPGDHILRAAAGVTSSASRPLSFIERKTYIVELELEVRTGGLSLPPAGPESTGGPAPIASIAPAVSVPPVAPLAREESTQRTWGWVVVGAGGAGLGVGIISGILALNSKSNLDDLCSPPGSDAGQSCPSSVEGDLSTFRTGRTVSYVGFGAAAVGIAVGIGLLVTAPADRGVQAKSTLVPWIDLGAAGVRGAF